MSEKVEWPGRWAKHRRKSPLPPEAEKIRKWIRKTMKEKNMTQTQLSVEADVALGQISRILNGCSETRAVTLMKLAGAMGYRVVLVPEDKIREARERGGRRDVADG